MKRVLLGLLTAMATLIPVAPAMASDLGACLEGACDGDVDCNDRCYINAAQFVWVTCGSWNNGACCHNETDSYPIGAHSAFFWFTSITHWVREEWVCPSGHRTLLFEGCQHEAHAGVCFADPDECCIAAWGYPCGGADGC